MDRWVYWNVFPGLRCRLRVTARARLAGPLAIGASLMVMIFAGGHISGGHYNPTVTLGVWIRGAWSTLEASFYLVA